MQAPYHEASLYHFFLFFCANRKDETASEETLSEPTKTPVLSTGKFKSYFIYSPLLIQTIMEKVFTKHSLMKAGAIYDSLASF